MSRFQIVPFSGGEACGGYSPWHGDAVCPGEERGEDVTSDALQPLSQDQREAGRHQQHPGSSSAVSFCLSCF